MINSPQAMLNTKLGFQAESKSPIRVMSEEEVAKKQKQQKLQMINAKVESQDSGADFFLEYMRLRGTKLAQSPTQLAKVLAEKGADEVESDPDKVQKDAPSEERQLAEVADSLDIPVEEVKALIDASEGDESLTEEQVWQLGSLFNIAQMNEEAKKKLLASLAVMRVLSGTDYQNGKEMKAGEAGESGKPGEEIDWAAVFRFAAEEQTRLVQALETGEAHAFTGQMPDIVSLREKAASYARIAETLEQIKTA